MFKMNNKNLLIEENWQKFARVFQYILPKVEGNRVIVSDADETISLFDATNDFFAVSGLKEIQNKIKQIFKEFGTTFEGFSKVREEYLKIPKDKYKEICKTVAKKVKIRKNWEQILNKEDYQIIILTAGIPELWKEIVKIHKWPNVILIGSGSFIMHPSVKGDVVRELQSTGKQVLAFGDNRLDFHMLDAADVGCLISNERGSPGTLELVSDRKHIIQAKMEHAPIPKIQCMEFEIIINNFLNH